MADRAIEIAGQRGRLILVTGDRHEPTSHELTSPDPLAQLARLLTNLPGDVPAVLATVAWWPPFTMCLVADREGIHAAPGAARKRRAPRNHSANRGAVPGSASARPAP